MTPAVQSTTCGTPASSKCRLLHIGNILYMLHMRHVWHMCHTFCLIEATCPWLPPWHYHTYRYDSISRQLLHPSWKHHIKIYHHLHTKKNDNICQMSNSMNIIAFVRPHILLWIIKGVWFWFDWKEQPAWPVSSHLVPHGNLAKRQNIQCQQKKQGVMASYCMIAYIYITQLKP